MLPLFAIVEFLLCHPFSTLILLVGSLLTCKNRLPYNLYCVGGDVKHCSIHPSSLARVRMSSMCDFNLGYCSFNGGCAGCTGRTAVGCLTCLKMLNKCSRGGRRLIVEEAFIRSFYSLKNKLTNATSDTNEK